MKFLGIILAVTFGFLVGYVAHSAAYLGYFSINSDASGTVPGIGSPENLAGVLTLSQSPERISPSNRIPESSIHVFDNRVVLDIPNPEWAAFTNTNSMDPVIDESSHAIEIIPQNAGDVNIGDIASYKSSDGATIIHRVIGKGADEDGDFFIFKGDNNPARDPGKVRFNQIQRLVVAIIY